MYVRDRSGQSAIPSTTGGFYVEMPGTHYNNHHPTPWLKGGSRYCGHFSLSRSLSLSLVPKVESEIKRVESAHRVKNAARILKRWRSAVRKIKGSSWTDDAAVGGRGIISSSGQFGGERLWRDARKWRVHWSKSGKSETDSAQLLLLDQWSRPPSFDPAQALFHASPLLSLSLLFFFYFCPYLLSALIRYLFSQSASSTYSGWIAGRDTRALTRLLHGIMEYKEWFNIGKK